MTPKKEPLVLLVDPNGDTLTTLYSILDRGGCLVATSHPDVDALRYVAAHQPDVALVGRHPEDAPARLLPIQIRRLSPKTRVLLFDPSLPWKEGEKGVRALLEAVRKPSRR